MNISGAFHAPFEEVLLLISELFASLQELLARLSILKDIDLVPPVELHGFWRILIQFHQLVPELVD
jgi:hypothetical protein